MTQPTHSLDHVQEATDTLLALFTDGNLPKAIAPVLLPRGGPSRPSDTWSLGNRMVMMLVGRTDDARGFRQWETVGRRVKKGAKAIWILAPNTKKITDTDPDGRETERIIVTGFRGVPTFRVEDTEGAELPSGTDPAFTPGPLPLKDVAEAWGYRVEYGPSRHGEYGYHTHDNTLIHLSTEDPMTFWHELAHAADARTHAMQGGQPPDQEIVAETVAAILAIAQGTEPNGQIAFSRDYIEQYCHVAHKPLLPAVMGLLTRIQTAVAEITTAVKTLEAAPLTA